MQRGSYDDRDYSFGQTILTLRTGIGLTQAGLADTSLMLAVDPRLVRADRLGARAGPTEGVHGDPRRSSAELGQLGVDVIVTQTVAAIREGQAAPVPIEDAVANMEVLDALARSARTGRPEVPASSR